jgi:hypothetical protein
MFERGLSCLPHVAVSFTSRLVCPTLVKVKPEKEALAELRQREAHITVTTPDGSYLTRSDFAKYFALGEC